MSRVTQPWETCLQSFCFSCHSRFLLRIDLEEVTERRLQPPLSLAVTERMLAAVAAVQSVRERRPCYFRVGKDAC